MPREIAMQADLCRAFFDCRGKAPVLRILAAACAMHATLAAAAGSASVEVKGGNVLLVQGGQQRVLTKSGKDADPALSPDGKWIAFTRIGNPESTGSQGDCKSGAQADELRRIRP